MERRYHIRVCRGPECGDRLGSTALYAALRAALIARGLSDRCELGWQSCFGRCTQGPNVLVRDVTPLPADPAEVPSRATALYNAVDVLHVEDIVHQHVEQGVIVSALVRPSSLSERLRAPRGGTDPSSAE